MVFGQSGARHLLKLGLGSILLVLCCQQQALASLATPTEVPLVLKPTIDPPEIPPLGDPDHFLPRVEIPIRLVVKLSDRRLYVYQGEQLKTTYSIAIGRSGWETPTGVFEVRQMMRYPTWENPFSGKIVPPGANNPLGSRWIGFWTDGRNEIGFHGTPDESLIGEAVSHGCIRMRDKDVQALFEIVTLGTAVIVEP